MVEHWTTNILPTNEATLPSLRLPAMQAATTNILINHELLNHEYFDPRKLPAIYGMSVYYS